MFAMSSAAGMGGSPRADTHATAGPGFSGVMNECATRSKLAEPALHSYTPLKFNHARDFSHGIQTVSGQARCCASGGHRRNRDP